MRRALPALLAALGFAAVAVAQQPKAVTGPAFEQEPFGKMPDTKDKNGKTIKGPTVTQYTLTNKNNVVVKATEYGGIITEIHVPDKNGKFADVVLGFDKLDGYLKGHPYFGSNAGRCAQPHREGQVHPRRQGVHAGDEQRPEPPARRQRGLRQEVLEGRAVPGRDRPRREVHLHQPGRRGGLPRPALR